MAPLAHVTLLCLGLVCMTTLVTSQRRVCSTPEWPSDFEGENPVAANRGKVVLVALMESAGLTAYRMQALQAALTLWGPEDVEIVLVIGGGENVSQSITDRLPQDSTFTVVRDTTEDQVLLNKVFKANKDDFLVFDRCGQLAYVIPYDVGSFMQRMLAAHVLHMTSRGEHRCRCSLDPVRR